MKKLSIFLLFLLPLALYGCSPTINSPVLTRAVMPTSTLTPLPAATPAPRWAEYESALSQAVLGAPGGLCEWEIYGVSGNEVYVWVMCEFRPRNSRGGSLPAVIYLRENGAIERVALPEISGVLSVDLIRALYPPNIQPTVFAEKFNVQAAETSLGIRRTGDGPPLLVILGTPLP